MNLLLAALDRAEVAGAAFTGSAGALSAFRAVAERRAVSGDVPGLIDLAAAVDALPEQWREDARRRGELLGSFRARRCFAAPEEGEEENQ